MLNTLTIGIFLVSYNLAFNRIVVCITKHFIILCVPTVHFNLLKFAHRYLLRK